MDQTALIAQGIKTAWTAYGSLATDVPGGLVYGLNQPGSLYPYATLLITLGETQYTTGTFYVQDYHCDIRVWATQQVATAAQIQTDIYNALSSTNLTLPNLATGCRLVQNTIDTGNVTEDPERNQQGQYTLITQARFILTITETRP